MLCEVLRDELNGGKISPGEIIDLDAPYTGPDAKAVSTPQVNPDCHMIASIGFTILPLAAATIELLPVLVAL